jgi:hypothetical protein
MSANYPPPEALKVSKKIVSLRAGEDISSDCNIELLPLEKEFHSVATHQSEGYHRSDTLGWA